MILREGWTHLQPATADLQSSWSLWEVNSIGTADAVARANALI